MTKDVSPLWFSPSCDMVLSRLQAWDTYYELNTGYTINLPVPKQNRGIPFRIKVELIGTRKFMDGTKVIDKPTAFVHWVPWTKPELDHLVRIVSAMRPNSPIEEIAIRMRDLWTKQPGILLSGGYRVLELASYQDAIKTLITVLQEVKSGIAAKSMEQMLEHQASQGKDLFET